LPDNSRHRRHLSAVRFCQLAKAVDRFGKLPASCGEFRGCILFGFRIGLGVRRKRNGGTRLWFFASVAAPESRNVAAARHLDDERIVAADPGIVPRQRLAHADCLDPHDRIGLRIKIDAAAQCLDGDGISFELAAVAGQRHFDNERKKTGQSESVAEGATVDDATEFLADVVGMQMLLIRMRVVKIRAIIVSPRMSILHRPPRWLNRPGGS